MAETCWICEDKAYGHARKVRNDDSAPLCDRHWNWWVAKYLHPSEAEPPCGAHLISESTNPDPKETP